MLGLVPREVAFQAWWNARHPRRNSDGSPLGPWQLQYLDELEEAANRLRAANRAANPMSDQPLRTSDLAASESPQSENVPELVTVREASKDGYGLLPWGEHHIHFLIRTTDLPVVRRKPMILLERDAVAAWKLHRDDQKDQEWQSRTSTGRPRGR